MPIEATHGICCEPDPITFNWRKALSVLLKIAIFETRSPKQNGVVNSLPVIDARAMADIGLGELGNDNTHPALRDMTIRHEIEKLDQQDRFGR